MEAHQPLVGGAWCGSAGRLPHPGQTPPDHRVPRHGPVLFTPVRVRMDSKRLSSKGSEVWMNEMRGAEELDHQLRFPCACTSTAKQLHQTLIKV